MTYLDLAAIESTPLTPDPFDHLVVPGCLSATALETANRDYPDIDTPGNKDLETLHYGPGFRELIDELNGPALRQVISTKFNIDPGSVAAFNCWASTWCRWPTIRSCIANWSAAALATW